MLTPARLLVGFAFKALATDESTWYVVNVCGHDSVGWPLARSMEPVDETYIERNGIDNLIVPISVGEPRQPSKGEFSYCVDVVVHTALLKKCVPGHHLFQHLTAKLLTLSLEWVHSECGVQLLQHSCSLLGNPFYFSDVKGSSKSLDEVMRMAAELLKHKKQEPAADEAPPSVLPRAFNLAAEEPKERKKPLIQEVITTPGIKKGFLTSGNSRLYGPEGSSEGSGKAPDPLAHIPESLRSKCRIIDTRNLGSTDDFAAVRQQPATQPTAPPTSEFDKVEPAGRGGVEDAKWEALSVERTESSVVARFSVPSGVTSLRDVDLSASGTALEINGMVFELAAAIDPEKVKAKFVKSTRVLVVTCPLYV